MTKEEMLKVENNNIVNMHKLNFMKNEIIKELQHFKGIEFHEEEHFYTLNNYRFGISATSLIEIYAQEFDSDSVSQMVANKRGISQQEVLAEWKKENEFSCIKGSCIHLKAQSLWMNTNYEIDYNTIDDTIDKNRLKKEYDIMSKQAINFYNDYKDMYDMIQDEFIVWSKEFDIAGSIDGIMYNKYAQQCCILDFKSNKDLQFESKYHKKMKVPLHKLDDVNGQHYYIQLSIYKYLIEKYTNIKVDELFIVYFNINADNYEIIPIPYLKDEVEEILENRRVKNMNSVPILLIGASGTGKSTSLRNFTRDEVAVVNVLGKPLPFKSDIKAPQCDDYAKILKAIDDTKKKTVVIDDAGYLITNEFMGKSSIKGFDKYNEMANNFFNLINGIKKLKGGKTVYIIMHEDTNEDGDVKPKTIGKLLDDKVNLQGMFTICIRSMFENGNYIFRLKTNGQDCVKTPFGMFENDEMENDLKAFDKVVREYYDLDKQESEENK